MIRPVTLLAFLAAAGSGLYLYQTKLSAQLLDRRITHTVAQIRGVRQQTALLTAEYALLNDPRRLQKLSDQFLKLPPTTPGQFVTMADLAQRLPPVGPPPAPPAPPQEPAAPAVTPGTMPADGVPVATAAPAADTGTIAAARPHPPAAAHRLAARRVAHPTTLAEARAPHPAAVHAGVARVTVARSYAARVMPAATHTAQATMPRPAALRPTPAVSMLGMAWTAPRATANTPGGGQ